MVTKIIFLALDKAQKPYYFGIKNSHQRCLTTALLGFAPALSTRASAPPPRNISVVKVGCAQCVLLIARSLTTLKLPPAAP